VFHVQLRQFPNVSREFNLSAEEVRARIVAPWLAGQMVRSGDRRWAPERAKLTIYEGPELRTDDIGMGRGWANVTKHGNDVTERMLGGQAQPAAAAAAELAQCKQRILERLQSGPLELGDCVQIAGSMKLGTRVSERLALAEQAVWELLHRGSVALELEDHDPGELGPGDWQRLLLDWSSWDGPRGVRLRLPAAVAGG
jgi:hypothetical protein